MEILTDKGIQVVLYLQGIGDWLTAPMTFLTFLGNEEFFLIVMPGIYWCLDTALGLEVGLILMVSNSLNNILKLAFHSPRPFWISTEVNALSEETSFGIPSGHAQNAVAVWGYLAASLRRQWGWLLAIFLITLIGVSRIYLAVHFPVDVVMGWLVGIIVLWAFLSYRTPATSYLKLKNAMVKILITFAISLFLILLGMIALAALGDWNIPQSWIQTAAINIPNAEPVDPLSLSGLITSASALFGLAAGYIFINQRMGFNARGVWWKRLLRYLVGVVGVVLIWAGLDAVFPSGKTLTAYSLRYLRYALVGMWVTGFGPWIFLRLNLAEGSHPSNQN